MNTDRQRANTDKRRAITKNVCCTHHLEVAVEDAEFVRMRRAPSWPPKRRYIDVWIRIYIYIYRYIQIERGICMLHMDVYDVVENGVRAGGAWRAESALSRRRDMAIYKLIYVYRRV